MKKLDMRDKVSTRLNGEHNTYLCGGPSLHIVDLINNIKSGSSDPNAEPPFIMPQLVPVVRELASYAPQWQYFFPITYPGANKLNEMYIISEGETIGWVQPGGGSTGASGGAPISLRASKQAASYGSGRSNTMEPGTSNVVDVQGLGEIKSGNLAPVKH